MGGISIWQLLIITVIVVLLFGTKKLRNLGSDLGSAVKGFKDSVTDSNKENSDQTTVESIADNVQIKENSTETNKKKDNV